MKRPCMTMTCRAAILCGLGAAGAAFAAPPKVTSVTLAQPQGSRSAVVSYQTDGPGIATFGFRTNGVPLAGVVWTVTGEISQYIPDAGPHAFTWDAGRDIPEHLVSNLTCEVTLWATNAPPPYAAVNLVADAATGLFPVRFWGSEGEVPLGVADGRWKKNWLLLRQIPSTAGGTVVLGSPDYEIGREAASETQRTVRVTAPFYMGVYEVTQYQWERVGTRSAPSYWSSPTWRDERPVEMVSWYDIRSSANGGNAAGTDWPNDGHAVGPGSFMYVLRAKTGRVLEFDLPTDAQWEYACRAGTDGAWSNGTGSTNNNADANLNLLGRYQRNGGQINTTGSTWVDPDNTNALGSVAAVTTLNATAAVGSYLPNAWGLYDMHGNAFEWCLDWYVSGDTVLLSGDDPVGPPAGSSRVRRGGRWYSGASDCRSARRLSNVPSSRNYGLGFRVAAPAAVDMSAGQ